MKRVSKEREDIFPRRYREVFVQYGLTEMVIHIRKDNPEKDLRFAFEEAIRIIDAFEASYSS
jgi:hypothetical protein